MTGIWMMRAQAVMWLRYERDCPIVALERGRGACGIPDAIGVTPTRRIIEVEIKRSMADFRHNEKKYGARLRGAAIMGGRFHYDDPAYFYFFVEAAMVEKCRAELPAWAGLISAPLGYGSRREYNGILKPIVIVSAPENKSSRKLTIKECHRMAKHQTGTLSSVLNAMAHHERKSLVTPENLGTLAAHGPTDRSSPTRI